METEPPGQSCHGRRSDERSGSFFSSSWMPSLLRPVRITVSVHAALLVVLLLLLRFRFDGVRYTAFYDVEGQQRRQQDRAAAMEAASTAFTDSLFQLSSASPAFPSAACGSSDSAESSPLNRLCLVLVTTRRARPYLRQALASYVLSHCPPTPDASPAARAGAQSCGHIHPLHVFYAASAAHPDFDALERANLSFLPTVRGSHLASTLRTDAALPWHRSELLDYASALQLCKAQDSGQGRHVTAVLEDDVVVTRGMVEKLITEVEALMGSDDWLLVRLFRSSYWDGWEADDWPTLLALALLGGCVGAAVALLVLLLRQQRAQAALGYSHKKDAGHVDGVDDGADAELLPTRSLTPDTAASSRQSPSFRCEAALVAAWSLGLSTGLTLTALLTLNRQNLPLFAPSKGLHPVGDSAGTQAVLFSSQHIPALLAYLHLPSHPSVLPIDVALNDFVRLSNLRQLQLIPHLVDHRGAYSSAGHKNQGEYLYLKVSSHFEDEVDVQGWVRSGWRPAVDSGRCDHRRTQLQMLPPNG